MTDERAKLIDNAGPEEALDFVKQQANFQMMHHLLNSYGVAGICTMMRAHLDSAVKQMQPMVEDQLGQDMVDDIKKLSLAIEGVEDLARAQAKAGADRLTEYRARKAETDGQA